ncbi:MAG TPA: hypothetical protein VM055_03515 [Novosphingobium sp.]|nr:hypothetical protein [Novosphingobium sp.]
MRACPIVLIALSLTACAGTRADRFPSLATRPGERIEGTLSPAPASPPPPPTATTGSKLADLRAAALAAYRTFGERRGRAAQLASAAQGAAVASEAWSVAQVALAELEAARSAAMVALADLDALYVVAADAAVPSAGSGDLDAITALRAEVTGWVAEEDAVLAGLRGRVAG